MIWDVLLGGVKPAITPKSAKPSTETSTPATVASSPTVESPIVPTVTVVPVVPAQESAVSTDPPEPQA